ncbi:MAG: marine proteobacterial sortase target protein [Acidobacteria bacterium]|nr:MAG: marine proteobacterial sortase target protein [Acidobacteriota bacterium]
MTRKLTLLILLLIPIAVFAQEDERPLVTLNQVKSGMMLLKTNHQGVYVVAPTVETDVKLQVRGLVLRGEVRQTFRNPESTCAEAIYAFPLPEDAAVDRLRMTVGMRVIEGEIKERKEAQVVYEQAKSEGKKASLLTQERPNLFTVSIANIGSGEEVVVTIDYQQNVDYRDGVFRLRFPMTIAPRYIPGQPSGAKQSVGWSVDTDQVPDASRVTPPVNMPGSGRENRLRLSVDLDSGVSLRRVDSSYQKVATTVVSGSRYNVTLASGDVPADRDFELVWQPDLGNEPKAAMFTEQSGPHTYALLMLMPPKASTGVRLPKESIFIVDTSGSMAGTSLSEAKNALQLALDRLSPQDRFNVIEFNSVTHVLFNQPQQASPDVVARAKKWVDSLVSTGGTEMLPALQAALLNQSPGDGVVRQVVFMTDGGVGNEEQLLTFIRTNLGQSRLFTVGIGSAPNSHFMRGAARFGRGTFTYIGSVTEVQEKMTALFEKLESPVLTNVELHLDDPRAEMWPQRIPDLYVGEPVVVAVRFSSPTGRVTASGKLGDHQWNDVQSLQVTGNESGVGKLWARRKIEALTDTGGDVHQQIVELGLDHHLVTEFTSLVAVDHTPSGAPQQTCETRAVPVNLPLGWGGIEGSLPTTATPAPLEMLIGIVLVAIAAVIAVRS